MTPQRDRPHRRCDDALLREAFRLGHNAGLDDADLMQRGAEPHGETSRWLQAQRWLRKPASAAQEGRQGERWDG